MLAGLGWLAVFNGRRRPRKAAAANFGVDPVLKLIFVVNKSNQQFDVAQPAQQARRSSKGIAPVSRQPSIDEPRRRPPDSDQRAPVLQTMPLAPTRVFASEELFEGATEIGIRHEGAHYRLKITRQGKLILNK